MFFRSAISNAVALAAFGLAAGFAPAQTVSLKQLDAEREVVDLIGQIQDVGSDVQESARHLTSMAASRGYTKWSNSHHLDQIKKLIHEGLSPAVARLAEIRVFLPDWQQDSLDLMLDSAKVLTADVESAVFKAKILALEEAGTSVPAPSTEYQEWIAQVGKHSDSLVKTSGAASDYAAGHQLALEVGLNLPRN